MTDNHSITYTSQRFQYKTVYHPVSGRKMLNAVLEFIADEHRPVKQRLAQREKHLLSTVEVSFQGEVVQVRHSGLLDRPQLGSGRAPIVTFTAKARKRMMDTVSRIDWVNRRSTFVTLTYHSNMCDARRAKRDLRAFLKRIYRRYGNIPVLWKMEPQKRGAWHFHLICFDLPYISTADILQHWREVTGEATITQVKIEPIASARKARSYVCKYLGKPLIDHLLTYFALMLSKCPAWMTLVASLDYLPNLAAIAFPGRFWGIENRANMRWAVLKTVSITINKAYFDFKRSARCHWQGVNGNKNAGFTIYVRNPERWFDYLFELIGA